MRVLLADDHVVIRDGLRTLLQTHNNFQICGEASNGREAVDLAVQKKPDVVIININLPEINGIEATRQIRKQAPGTEILIFTKENNQDLLREALRAGARGYLLKSAPDEQIIEAIEALARHEAFCSSQVRRLRCINAKVVSGPPSALSSKIGSRTRCARGLATGLPKRPPP
jgi:DNA-binding NarL/FixJ family response regulator